MPETIERPEFCTDPMLVYLDDLRESGETNMFGAASYLGAVFQLPNAQAKKVLAYWMKTFAERHPHA